jgi:beta-1,4-mannosyl-glycoprotein beta-1,4-N-acetylglucosaminyltransferase
MAMTFDCFTILNELDLLEIRLNILDEFVDNFVICESRQTFSGQEKPLNFFENKERFSKWAGKIRYIVPENLETNDPFERAGYQKDFTRKCLESVAVDDDVVYFGDLDEIWKPKIIDDKVYNLKQLNYSYYLNNRSSEEWIGTVVGKWGTFKTNDVNHWRATHDNVLDDGGWHFTNMGGFDQIVKKVSSYDHAHEIPQEWFKEQLKANIDKGVDYLGRPYDWKGNPFKMWKDENQLPEYLLTNKSKWKHLWN